MLEGHPETLLQYDQLCVWYVVTEKHYTVWQKGFLSLQCWSSCYLLHWRSGI